MKNKHKNKMHRDMWDTVIHVTVIPERRKDKTGQSFIWRNNGWEISKPNKRTSVPMHEPCAGGKKRNL